MEIETITTSLEAAKRLTIRKQFLAGNTPEGTFNDKLKSIIRNVGYIQWDPVTVVAPSHLISIWSRIGKFDWSELDKMMWNDKEVLFHWTPIAWLVLAEDYPIFYSLMARYPDSMIKGWASHAESASKFLKSHHELKQKVMKSLNEGPAETGQLKGYGKKKKKQDGWSSANEVNELLFHLQMTGEVMVVGHSGKQNLWGLTDNFLPRSVERKIIPAVELEMSTAIRAMRALGVSAEYDIYRYFVRGRYADIKGTLRKLLEDGKTVKVKIEGEQKAREYYILSEDIRALDSIIADKWEPWLSLISPFDNIITLRDRTQKMFNFNYILEQFVPNEKRKYGTYVLPILWGSNLVGRVDAKFEKEQKTLNILRVFAEPGFENEAVIGERLADRVEDFADFLGAEKVKYGKIEPEQWTNMSTNQ
ncbi:MAG: winged helix DNA-binding domain-containing protein [Candidatus Thermoplasmatota archaeon]|nr:winged helix DNA-binding domain-containing protein [Candidatus Thermoplasmatota archaeon]